MPPTDPPLRAAPPRRTQAERRAESESRLITAAVELIVEQGLLNTSLADIGKRAGSSHALVNHRFGSKDELVDRIIEVATEHYATEALNRIGRHTGLDAVLDLCEIYLDMIVSPDPIGRVHVVLWSEAVAHTATRREAQLEWDRQFRAFLGTLIVDGVAQGSIRADVAVEEAALTIVGALRGAAMQMLLDEGIDLAGAQSLIRQLVLADLQVRG